MFVRVELNFYS